MLLQAVESDAPDLLLLDIHMPGIDGYEVCRRLKENEKLRDIPVLSSAIVESSGTHFDPGVVEAFVELEEQFREVRDSMED